MKEVLMDGMADVEGDAFHPVQVVGGVGSDDKAFWAIMTMPFKSSCAVSILD
jgi:hypothetical protein